MAYKLIVFDLDGTILDTLEDLADSVNYALAHEGLAQRTLAEVRSFIGNGIHNLIERSVPAGTNAETIEAVFCVFKSHYADHSADKTKPYDGIPAMLDAIRAAGIKTAVVSNKADFAVQNLAKLYFPGQLDSAAGEKAGVPKKPAPDSVYSVLKELGAEKQEAVYVGDSEVDIVTAVNAGLDCIIVDWGFRDHDTLEIAGAEVIVSTPAELQELLLK